MNDWKALKEKRIVYKKNAMAAYKANALMCIAVALVFCLCVKGSLSISGSAGTADYDSYVSYMESYNTETENAGATVNGTEAVAESSTEDTSAVDESYLNNYYRMLALREGLKALGAYLPACFGMFISLAMTGITRLAIFIIMFLSAPLEIGGAYFFIRNSYRDANIRDVLFSFKKGRYWNAVMAQAYRMMFIFLWSLLLIGPGVIKAYEYCLVPYIMAENPETRENEALKLSKQLMMGHRKEMFLLDLSFLGWDLLGIVTLGIAGVAFTNPYKYAAKAEFYTALRGPVGDRRNQGPRKQAPKAQKPGKKGDFDGYHAYQKKSK